MVIDKGKRIPISIDVALTQTEIDRIRKSLGLSKQTSKESVLRTLITAIAYKRFVLWNF
jgi:hypothetical protein